MESADQFKAVQPLQYYKRFLDQNIRPDGRRLQEARTTTVNVNFCTHANGSAMVRIGNTTVCCGVKAEITTPSVTQPNDGIIVPNVDLPPLCSSAIQSGPPTDYAQTSTKLIDDILVSSNLIEKKDLCIVPSKYVWVLYCDIVCLDLDGNLIDASLLIKLPVVSVNEKTGKLEYDHAKTTSLTLRDEPIATTFAAFDSDAIIMDPTLEEENLCNGSFTITLNKEDDICSLFKPGGTELDNQKLQNCLKHCKRRVNSVRSLMQNAVSS
ncbi:DgyrCDS9015 [Dimorphilus gyrociliatus]|uniref:Ribosomal RNA-processing protein 43 n=1 Tax=Dimorphilus gyrociliatus TaxID=2664684 RepID=A0A7I8W128_9ANNE|nr:DgyrCDS9015 [Dimorphilus gyrociliatus]